MKRLLLFSASVSLLSMNGWASSCQPGTLAAYIALGPAGCVLGNLQVGSFSYVQQSSGGAAEITPDQIQVAPLLAPAGAFALQFSAPWSVQNGQIQASRISYIAVSPSANARVQQVRLDGTGFQSGMFGAVLVNQAVATLASPAGSYDLQVYLKCLEVCRSQTSASANITPIGTLAIADKITLQSKMGTASMTGFADWFFECVPCVVP